MNKKPYEDKLFLEKDFGEALERFAETDPKEVAASIARSKKAKPRGGKLKPPGNLSKAKNVVQLRNKLKPSS
jgi:hypothetical protein